MSRCRIRYCDNRVARSGDYCFLHIPEIDPKLGATLKEPDMKMPPDVKPPSPPSLDNFLLDTGMDESTRDAQARARGSIKWRFD
jgi:hypothetical protein